MSSLHQAHVPTSKWCQLLIQKRVMELRWTWGLQTQSRTQCRARTGQKDVITKTSFQVFLCSLLSTQQTAAMVAQHHGTKFAKYRILQPGKLVLLAVATARWV